MEKYRVTIKSLKKFKKVSRNGIEFDEYTEKESFYGETLEETKKFIEETERNAKEFFREYGIKILEIKLEKIIELEVREYERNEF